MHPWHDCYVDDALVEAEFPVIIEVPKGSKNKYELDKETGLLRLDRVLYSAVHYPADYGFIPRTFCDDDDPLDALVLGQEPVHPLTIVEARAIAFRSLSPPPGPGGPATTPCRGPEGPPQRTRVTVDACSSQAIVAAGL